ncbi:MAG: extracellular solute-binding protein [Nocardioidaceae bacterium]|nr:extracellular solute-binding protein [Nocardioidaceae bacterium]
MARFGWRTGAVVVVVALAVLIGMMVLSSSHRDPKIKADPTESTKVTDLQFAVWGAKAEIEAYQGVVDDYNASSSDTRVTVKAWPDAAAMLADIRSGDERPDLYMLPRSELAETIKAKRNRPLLDLLDERKIPIGDDFERNAVAAFSTDDDLQCMPYISAPTVMYYNTKLIDFDKMAEADLPTPSRRHTAWNLAEFRAAAEFASRPRRKTRGVYIEPSLKGLAPFIYSGGGHLFNEDQDPTSLALADDDSADSLRKTLEILRDPRLTLTSKQLAKKPAIDWFKQGRLGMIAGTRQLTPQLRETKGLNFDVMPMPSLGTPATLGDLTGVCLMAGRPARVESSANFLTYLISDEAVARVSATGYVQPAKQTVSLGPDFQQVGQMPEHSAVFTNSIRSMVLPPLIGDGSTLVKLIDPEVKALFTRPTLPDLDAALEAIDEKSRTLLTGDDAPEPSDDASSEAPSPSGSPSGGPSTKPSATEGRSGG